MEFLFKNTVSRWYMNIQIKSLVRSARKSCKLYYELFMAATTQIASEGNFSDMLLPTNYTFRRQM